jgi:hypothetical protein
LILIYFSVTTITKVGLGDFVPKSDFERIIVSIVLVISIIILSFTILKIIYIVSEIKNFDTD